MDLEAAAAAASELLFELSGHRFTGLCQQTVRPCHGTSCWSSLPYSLPYSYGLGHSYGYGPAAWYARSCCCGHLSKVSLAGYPIQEILEVKIDGVVLSPAEYELRYDSELVRLADVNGNRQWWPSCARDDLPDGPGTFFVSYSFGLLPPIEGVHAAAQLACEIAKACPGAGGAAAECKIPAGTVRINRQGIVIDTQALGLWLLGSVRTGMGHVDAFMTTYGTARRQEKVALYAPEADPYPVRTR